MPVTAPTRLVVGVGLGGAAIRASLVARRCPKELAPKAPALPAATLAAAAVCGGRRQTDKERAARRSASALSLTSALSHRCARGGAVPEGSRELLRR